MTTQRLLEEWWKEDPEMRYAEVLCGRNHRVCVRLYQITTEGRPGTIKVGEGEAGELMDATLAAVTMARRDAFAKIRRAHGGPPQGPETQDINL